jgi:4-amino-4-deoxy-L-arabinose transferase-like glycosyltransferase
MWNIVKKDTTIQILLILIIIHTIVHLPFINLPVLWDETSNFNAVNIIANHRLNPFTYFWGYKPQAMYMIPAILQFLGLTSLMWARLLILVFSLLSVYYMYRLGTKLFSRRVGVAASWLLVCFPLFAVQSSRFQDPVPFTALCLATLYYYFTGKQRSYLLAASFLVLTKETGIVIAVCLALINIITDFHLLRNDGISYIRKNIFLLLPVLVFGLWMIINRLTLGWYLWTPNVAYYSLSHLVDSSISLWAIRDVFLQYNLWIVFAVVITGMIFVTDDQTRTNVGTRKSLILLFFIIVISGIFLFSGLILVRYLLYLYALVFLMFSAILSLYIKNNVYYRLLIVFLCISFLALNIYRSVFVSSTRFDETSFAYIHDINLTHKLVQRFQTQYPDTVILAPWYVTGVLDRPEYGYISEKIPSYIIDGCSDLTQETITKLLSVEEPAKFIYVTDKTSLPCNTFSTVYFRENVCPDESSQTKSCYSLYSVTVK